MVWTESRDHYTDCCFHMTNSAGITSKTRNLVKYPDISSVIRPVSHRSKLLVTAPLTTWTADLEEDVNADLAKEGLVYDSLEVNLFENHDSLNHRDLATELLENCKELGCNMSEATFHTSKPSVMSIGSGLTRISRNLKIVTEAREAQECLQTIAGD
ncbi:hypothetical protein ILUMI_16030 [Ignelater luminosus]|uniref:Uncharacterized protein n=1 Tax=Ignelater luminosus TaxID=2038154 RepID=A0A8K0G9C1_IGNLU|nr:hypothetical protein ILUMI_16030 [Ignelater luminosus]